MATCATSNPAGGKCLTRAAITPDARNLAGFYPDDLAVSIDGRHLFVISSGQAEGDPKKPLPALETLALDLPAGAGHTLRRIEFDARDDPARLVLSASGKFAAVLMAKTNQTVGFDISIPEDPHLVGRTKPSAAEVPYVSHSARFRLDHDARRLAIRGDRNPLANDPRRWTPRPRGRINPPPRFRDLHPAS